MATTRLIIEAAGIKVHTKDLTEVGAAAAAGQARCTSLCAVALACLHLAGIYTRARWVSGGGRSHEPAGSATGARVAGTAAWLRSLLATSCQTPVPSQPACCPLAPAVL